jgi:hypothetical protein
MIAPHHNLVMPKNNITVGIILGFLVLVAIIAFVFSGSRGGTEEVVAGEYDTFAQCLYENGMRMYGSATCSFCARQRKDFGNSFHFVREIECDPRNKDNQANLCISKNISHTPTWIHEDDAGNDIFRFDSGVVSLEDLSKESGCPLIKDPLPDS